MGFKQYTETSFIPHARDLDDGNRGEKQGFPVEILALSIDIIQKSKHPEVWPFPDVLNHFPILGSLSSISKVSGQTCVPLWLEGSQLRRILSAYFNGSQRMGDWANLRRQPN